MQSLLFLPLAIANALTARLNDGYVVMDCTVCKRWNVISFILTIKFANPCGREPLVDESLVVLGYCLFTGMSIFNNSPHPTPLLHS